MNAAKRASPLLDGLECHFKWKLEVGIDKKKSEIITNVLEKLEIEPLRAVPYHCLLSYLYAIKRNLSYTKAYESLDQAAKLNADIASGVLTSDHIACQFVVEANRLHIDAIRGERTPDHLDRVKRLHSMWNDPDEKAKNSLRASVLLVKSLSCLRFGPSKYQIGADAAAESASIASTSLHEVYLQASLLARMRRLNDIQSVPDELEADLWAAALSLAEDNFSDYPRIESRVHLSYVLIHYAESIVRDAEKREQTESLASRARVHLQALSDDSLVEKNFRVILKCAKVYRILRMNDEVQELLNLLRPLKDRTRKAQVLFDLALAVKKLDDQEYEELLKKGQEVAEAPGHVWIDLTLIRHQSGKYCHNRLTPNQVIMRYDDLHKKYQDSTMDQAVVLYQKGAYFALTYALEKNQSRAIEWMLKAVETDPSVRKKIPHGDKIKMLATIQNWKDKDFWLAWYIDNVSNSPDNSLVQALYEESLRLNSKNKFALEHYGKNRLREKDFAKAEELFRLLRVLESHHESRLLLSQALLPQTEGDWDKLTECLTLGCKDACLAITKQFQKCQMDSTLQSIVERLNNRPTSSVRSLPTSFDTRSYELCAKVDQTLERENGFFIDKELDSSDLPTRIRDSIQQFLQIKTPGTTDVGRGNAMRENRLKASILFVTDPRFQTSELNDAIVGALKDAKEALDRHFQDFLIRTSSKEVIEYYPHGFSFAKTQIQKDPQYNAEKKKTDQVVKHKLLEMDSMVKLLSGMNLGDLKDNFKKKLPRVLDIPMKGTGERLIDLLVLRESQIFAHEGPWLVIWQCMVNLEKHAKKIDIEDLNRRLAKTRHTPLDAYEMMHRAVVFAEETEALLRAV